MKERKSAFTLIELMIVIAIISIISVIAEPGLKKAYEDFKMHKSISDADSLVQSYRACYLIYNEFPEDVNGNYIPEKISYFFPSNFFNKIKTYEKTVGEDVDFYAYKLTIQPYGASNFIWDFDNWATWTGNGTTYCMYLTLGNTTSKDSKIIAKYLQAFKNVHPLVTPQPFVDTSDIHIPFPEFPAKSKLDSKCKNRYY